MTNAGEATTTIGSARDLQRWLDDGGAGLEARGLRTVFGRGLGLSGASDGASGWISFLSAVGSGRAVLRRDGSSRLVAHRHADGGLLLDQGSAAMTAAELDVMVEALSARPA